MRFSDLASRRRLLQLALSSAAVGFLPSQAWSRLRTVSDPFALGVASGSPTHDSVVLWTRLLLPAHTPAANVRWEVAHDEHFSRPVQSGVASAAPELGHAVHVDVQGLSADRWYFYRFMVGDAVSATGRTRTFPAPQAVVARLRLAYASCQNWQAGYYSAYRHMLAENPDLVMFLGDYIYEYPNSSTSVRRATGAWVLTLDDYRERYALYKSDPHLQAMHQACPWLIAWDDHEVQNDYAGLHEGHSGAPTPDFPARRAAAYQAFYENMPLRASSLTQALSGLSRGAEMRIYSRLRYGQLASFYMLDARQYKDAPVCSTDGKKRSSSLDPANCPEWNDPKRSLLGFKQERWLEGELAHAGPQWNVLGQQTLLGQRDFRRGPEQWFWNEGWDGYSAARSRLTGALQKQNVANPVVLGGDIHQNWVGHVKADYADPRSAAVGVEFCGTSITSHSTQNDKLPARLAENPHFVFAEAEHRGYGVVDLTPKQLTTTLRVVDDVRLPDAGIQTLARFSVSAGRSVIEKA